MNNFRSTKALAFPLFIALSSLALGGCGDDDDSSPSAGSSGRGGQGGSPSGGSSGRAGSAATGGSAGSAGGGGSAGTGGSAGGGGSAGTGGSAGGGGSAGTGGSAGGAGTGGSAGGGGSAGNGGSGSGGPVLDTSFGDKGFVHVEQAPQIVTVTRFAVGDGDVIDVAGRYLFEPGPSAIARLLPNGAPDEGFGKGGVVLVEPTPTFLADTMMAELPGGGLVVSVGALDGENSVPGFTRLKADGTTDTSFGENGYTLVDVGGFDGTIVGIAQHEGRVWGVGTSGFFGYNNGLALRLLPDGKLDTSFNAPDGFHLYSGDEPTVFAFEGFTSTYVAADSSLYACGDTPAPLEVSASNFLVARYTPGGELDPNFGEGGVVDLEVHGKSGGVDVRNDACRGVVGAPDGKTVFVGLVASNEDGNQSNLVVVRLLPDGTPDPAFGQGGVFQLDHAASDHATGVVALPDGRIAVAGLTGDSVANAPFVLVLRADGTPDPGFADGGLFVFDLLSEESFQSVFLGRQSSGKLVVAGTAPTPFVARLNAP